MLTNVSGDYMVPGDSVNQKENVQGLEKNTKTLNPYIKPAEFDDSLEISKQAKELFQREKDIDFFKSMVLDSVMSTEEINSIMKLMREGDYINDDDLAEALYEDDELMKHLFS